MATVVTSSRRWALVLSAVLLAVYGGLFVHLAIRHVVYPGFTESMEGDVLQHIERAAHGQPLYPEPGRDFVALTYMPLYYYAAVPFYELFGDSFVGPRLLSVLCALASGGLLGWIGWRETRSAAVGMLASALFFAGYRIMDAYLTCAMPDALLLFWTVVGYCFFAYGTKRWHDAAWLVCFTLAFWTKQHGAFFFGFAVLYALLFRKNQLPRWVLVAGILLGGPLSYRLLGPLLGDHFFYHTFLVPKRWEHSTWLSIRRTLFVLACFAPFLCLLSGSWLREQVQRLGWRPSPLAWFTAATLATACITMTAAGSSNNHYIPFLAFLAVTAALGAQSLLEFGAAPQLGRWLAVTVLATCVLAWVAGRSFQQHAMPLAVPLAAAIGFGLYVVVALTRLPEAKRRAAVVVLFLGAQLGVEFYDPAEFVQATDAAAAVVGLRERLAALDQPAVWITYGNAPSALTGTKLTPAPSWVALEDLERQHGVTAQEEATWLTLRGRLGGPGLYLLSNDRIEHVPVWSHRANEVELVQDYGETFKAVRQAAPHWFGGSGYPRFLYRTVAKRES